MHFWLHIHSGYYDFQQRERDAETVRSFKKADIVDFFDQYFVESPGKPLRRLSVYLDAQRVSPEKLALVAAEFQKTGAQVDQARLATIASSTMTAEELLATSTELLREAGKSDSEVEQFTTAVKAILKETPIPEDVHLITDRDAWRAEQKPCAYAHPVSEYSHLMPKL